MKSASRRYKSSIGSVAISVKDVGVRVTFLLLIALSLTLIVLSRTEHPAATSLHNTLTDISIPLVQTLSEPSDTFATLVSQAHQWMYTHQLNTSLMAENEQLKRWRATAAELEAENRALRYLLNLAPVGKAHFISARVVSSLASPYTQAPLLSIGSGQGVESGMAAITGDGMVGRVIETGEHSARILPITDINSRISVITEQSRERAIAAGRNRRTLELLYLPEKSQLHVGERLVTSGDGKLLPAGLPIGIVTKIDRGQVEVTPLVDWAKLDYLSLIRIHSAATE